MCAFLTILTFNQRLYWINLIIIQLIRVNMFRGNAYFWSFLSKTIFSNIFRKSTEALLKYLRFICLFFSVLQNKDFNIHRALLYLQRHFGTYCI